MDVRRLAATCALVALSSPLFIAEALAVPVSYGGHSYEYIDVGGLIHFSSASAAASASTYLAMAGHLATITSAGENAFLVGLAPTFLGFAGAWIGGSNSGWVVGPEASTPYGYSNFGGSEPNNSPSNAYINIGTLFAGIAHGQWADAGSGLASGGPSSGDPVRGYFVEWEVSAVPLPAGLPLLAAGLGALGLVGWRKRRARTPAAF